MQQEDPIYNLIDKIPPKKGHFKTFRDENGKVCTKCGDYKAHEEFHNYSQSSGKVLAACIDCHNKEQREAYKGRTLKDVAYQVERVGRMQLPKRKGALKALYKKEVLTLDQLLVVCEQVYKVK